MLQGNAFGGFQGGALIFIMIDLLLSISILFTPLAIHSHSEVVGEIQIDQTGNTLTMIAVLDKKYLTYGLKKDADCKPDEMMSVCAGEYFRQSIRLTADDKNVELKKVDQHLEQNSLVITYQTELEASSKKLDVFSSYLFHLNDHALLKVQLSVDGQSKHYQLYPSKPSITAIF